jgi:hypothetical protein
MGNGRYYFNTGTWIRLIRLTDAVLSDPTAFRAVYEVLEKSTMEALDAARIGDDPLVLDRTSTVRIRADNGGQAIAELAHVQGDGTKRELVHEARVGG